MALQNIVIVGANGKLGNPLVEALLSSNQPKFNVTVVARSSSTYEGPEALNVVKVDFSNHADLVQAMKGQDALILAISAGPELAPTSLKLIDAAVEAGVKLIIPSEFGTDDTPLISFIFQAKQIVNEHLKNLAAENKVSYVLIRNGPWFDIALKATLGADIAAKKMSLYGEGDRKAHTTTIDSVCTAIISILADPVPYSNQIVHIHDFFITQGELLSALESVTGSKFEVEKVDVNEMGRAALEKIKKGEFNLENILWIVRQDVWSPPGSANWDEADDGARLGLGSKDLEEELRKIVAKTA